jgi:hypothetical protein
VGEIKGGIWRIMERLNWKNCKSVEITNNKNYDAVIELVDMPFEKGQEFIFDSENGLSRVCKVLSIRKNKIYIEIGDEV